MAVVRRLPWNGSAWQALHGLRRRAVHAVLLYGPRGIGKRSLALDLADAMLCAAPDADGYACGKCEECVLLAAGSHPDLRIVVPDTWAAMRVTPPEVVDDESAPAPEEPADRPARVSREILIRDIRALDDFINVTSHRGGARVIVLAPAEAMAAPAANALLKMLEEPPAGVFFIVLSEAIDEVLPTIRSRCVLQRVELPPRDVALQWLREQGVADAESRLAAAGGAPLLATDEAQGFSDPTIAPMLLEMLCRGRQLAAAEVAARIPRKIEVRPAITLFQRWAWDLLAHRHGAAVRYHPRHSAAVSRIADAADGSRLLAWDRLLKQAQSTSEHPLNEKQVVESALLAYAEATRNPETGPSTRR